MNALTPQNQREPILFHNERIGMAPITHRRSPTFPFRKTAYWDATQWGGGYIRCGCSSGAAVIKGNTLIDLRTGEVYKDGRFG